MDSYPDGVFQSREVPFMKLFDRDLRLLSAAVSSTALAIACSGGTPVTPSSGALVTFAVGTETFRAAVTTPDQVAAARATQSGGRAHSDRSRRSGNAGEYGMELASRGRGVRGSGDRAVRWTAFGRRT